VSAVRSFAFALLLPLLFALGRAQAPITVAAKMTTPPVIDGTINEDEWKSASRIEGLVDQNTGAKAVDTGTFWLGYDAKYIYFAARMADSSPGSIKATEYRTNVPLPGDDNIELDIDLSGSMNDFSQFQANAKGGTNITITGGRALKREWVGEIHAQGRITSAGWELEMRIPWQILPIPKPGVRDVRFNIVRFLSRLNRYYNYTYSQSDAIKNTPIWHNVDLPKPVTDRSIKLLPYMYAGGEQGTGVVANAGLDMKTSLTDQIQLVGTVNPDFRNVENAILNLDFSRFARLAAETRPFFLEGSQYMNSALYASQVIQRVDLGVNTYGKLDDKTQFGLIETHWQGHENDVVFNSSYNPNPEDSYRATLTQKISPGNENDAFLARYQKQLGPWSLFVRDMGSTDRVNGQGNYASYSVGYGQRGLGAFIGYDEATSKFNPALGFTPEVDFKGPSGGVIYDQPATKGPLQDITYSFSDLEYTHIDGSPYRRDPSGSINVVTRNGIIFAGSVDRPTFEGSHDRIDSLGVTYPSGNPRQNVGVTYTGGEIQGQAYRNINFASALHPWQKLQLNLSLQHVELGTTQDQAIFTGFYDLGHDRSLSGRLVQTAGHTNFYLAYRRSGNRGAEYYLILGDPNALSFRTSLILKMVIPFKA